MASSGDCDRDSCSYGFLQYEPSLAGNVVLLALFAFLIPIAFFLGIRYQSSIFSTTIITGLFLEIIGYVSRVLLAKNDHAYKAEFALSLLGTILAPTVISLAIFRLMPPIVAVYGDQYQAWRPNWHNLVFYAFTTACIVLQVVGGVLSTVPSGVTLNDIGVRLLVAGLAIHVSSLFIFSLLGVRFALAVRQRKGEWDQNSSIIYTTLRFKSFIIGLCVAVLLLIVRTLYRAIEVSAGSSSSLARNEILFLVLDGALVFLAVALLLVLFPGRMLASRWTESTTYSRRTTQKAPNRPAPIHLERTSYLPHSNRASYKSTVTNSPKTSPRSPKKSIPPPAARRNMVDHEQLW